MILGHRLLLATIALSSMTVFATIFIWYLLEDGSPQFEHDIYDEHSEPQYRPEGVSCDPLAIGPFIATDPLSNSRSCKESREYYRIQIDDLVQQTRSANSSALSIYFSHFQTVLAIFGMGFGFLTFGAAGAAALYARRAAVATEATVAATRDISNTQLRAWLYTHDHEVTVLAKSEDEKIDYIQFHLNAINSGTTPAINASMFIKKGIGTAPDISDDDVLNSDHSSVGPGEHFSTSRMSFTPSEIMSSRPSENAIFLKCVIIYNDIFSKTRRKTVKTLKVHYLGLSDVRDCSASEVTGGNFHVMASGENSMT